MSIAIVHALPGRVRLRLAALRRDGRLAAELAQRLKTLPGVRGGQTNTITGSVLVFYDPQQTDVAAIVACVRGTNTAWATAPLEEMPPTALTDRTGSGESRAPLYLAATSLAVLGLLVVRRTIGRRPLAAQAPVLFYGAVGLTCLSAFPSLKRGLQRIVGRGAMNADLVLGLATLGLIVLRDNFVGLVSVALVNASTLARYLVEKHSRQSIAGMLEKLDKTWLVAGDTRVAVPVQELAENDLIAVSQGEVIPVDGVVTEGQATLKLAAVTGESAPQDVAPGDQVLAGTAVLTGEIVVQVNRVGGDTYLSQLDRVVKSPTFVHAEQRAELFADRMLYVVLGTGVLTYILTRDMVRPFTLILAASPALALLATTATFAAALKRAAAQGIFFKGTRYLEVAGRLDTVLFDKTGTLTAAKPELADAVVLADKRSRDEIIALAAAAEMGTPHPLANTLLTYVREHDIAISSPRLCHYAVGRGVRAVVDGVTVHVGSEAFLREEGVAVAAAADKAARLRHFGHGVLYVSLDYTLSALLAVREVLQPDSVAAVERLRLHGVNNIGLVTGDAREPAHMAAEALGLTQVWTGMQPRDKAALVERLRRQGHVVAMVGEGVNDGPAMRRADIGVAIDAASLGRVLAAGDVVVTGANISRVADVVALGQRTAAMTRQNMNIAAGTSLLGLGLAAVGLIGPIGAGILQSAGTVVILANAARMLPRPRPAWPGRRITPAGKPAAALPAALERYRQPWYQQEVAEVVAFWRVHGQSGLDSAEAAKRLAIFGNNALAVTKKPSLIKLFLDQFNNFMVYTLLGAAGISLVMRRVRDAATIVAILIFNGGIGVYQEIRAQNSMDALLKMSAPHAQVVRDGQVLTVAAAELVPGDVILLEAGDRVPADARLIAVRGLEVEEAALTGESVPVAKSPEIITSGDVMLGDRSNMVFMGTNVTKGRARAVVVATGMLTELGLIARDMQETSAPLSPLEKRMAILGRYFVYASGVACLAVVAIGLVQGRALTEMFMTGISLAVAAIPEGLPSFVTITLALGVQRMVKKHVVVRKLPAVETLGCATIVCTDKTGTLTKNEMTVTEMYADGQWFDVSGKGYDLAGDITPRAKMVVAGSDGLRLALEAAVLCNNAVVARRDDAVDVKGDPTEIALLVAAAKAGILREELQQVWKRVAEMPFEAERRLMTVYCRENGGGTKCHYYLKGAPDTIVPLCDKWYKNGAAVELRADGLAEVTAAVEAMSRRALRVLAVAYKFVPATQIGDADWRETETGLTFLGLYGMYDPPRPEAIDAIARCRDAGVLISMVTGDHLNTAVAIARQMGLLGAGDLAVTGQDFAEISDAKALEIVDRIRVFARMSPQQKLRVVKLLKCRGHIVAMTGDGVNDAPALKEANIGIAMGKCGTDVCKDAADIVITDDNFASIVDAIEEGRTIYGNLCHSVEYLLATNIGEVIMMLAGMMAGLPLPLLASQILLVNLVGDGLPALALGVDPVDPQAMRQPPRRPDEKMVDKRFLYKLVRGGALVGMGAFGVYALAFRRRQDVVYARTMGLATLILSELLYVFHVRTVAPTNRENPYMTAAVLSSAAMMFGVFYTPWLRRIFDTAPLQLQDWLVILPVGIGTGLLKLERPVPQLPAPAAPAALPAAPVREV